MTSGYTHFDTAPGFSLGPVTTGPIFDGDDYLSAGVQVQVNGRWVLQQNQQHTHHHLTSRQILQPVSVKWLQAQPVLARLLDRGLNEPTGYVLPLERDVTALVSAWVTGA